MSTWTAEELRRIDALDAAYRAKYARYPSVVPHVLDEQARAAAVALVPAD